MVGVKRSRVEHRRIVCWGGVTKPLLFTSVAGTVSASQGEGGIGKGIMFVGGMRVVEGTGDASTGSTAGALATVIAEGTGEASTGFTDRALATARGSQLCRWPHKQRSLQVMAPGSPQRV